MRRVIDISRLSQLTGVNVSTLRSWESRHALITPSRSVGGHRLYSAEDVERLMLVKDLIAVGHRLSELRGLTIAELKQLQPAISRAGAFDRDIVLKLERAVDDCDVDAFGMVLRFVFAASPPALAVDVYGHAVRYIGQRWQDGQLGVGGEHRLSAKARDILTAATSALAPAAHRRPIAFATLGDERHELGLLAGAYLAASLGHRMIYFGAGMPARALAVDVAESAAALLVISAVHSVPGGSLQEDLVWLDRGLPEDIPIWIGAHEATIAHLVVPSRMVVVRDYAEFRRRLSMTFES
ncbi:MerR family transcriptional regulator [Phreatobacter sp.]|uniref:MerR family transcriptional regulator n=1 Tax=Phreatobacter sp. TaxID=1966341 RepID=UPI0025D74189|nr:MerR family transcriptional regulator [Phreatobacter sp.]